MQDCFRTKMTNSRASKSDVNVNADPKACYPPDEGENMVKEINNSIITKTSDKETACTGRQVVDEPSGLFPTHLGYRLDGFVVADEDMYMYDGDWATETDEEYESESDEEDCNLDDKLDEEDLELVWKSFQCEQKPSSPDKTG